MVCKWQFFVVWKRISMYIHVHLYLYKAISYINRNATSIIFISKAYCTNNTANRVSVNIKSGEHSLAQNERILSPSLWIYGFACHVIMIIIMWEMFFRGSLYTKKSCFQILFIMCHASEKCPSSVQV